MIQIYQLVYVDESPLGVTLTLAQENIVLDEKEEHIKVWKPVDYTSRTKSEAEKG